MAIAYDSRPATHRPAFRLSRVCGAMMAVTGGWACAQTTVTGSASGQLPPVTVTAPAPARVPGVAGLGDRPVEELPLQATIVSREQLDDVGAQRLADLTRFDPAITDAYNSPGYWDFLAVRGYVLDQRFNYRREGLPISAETAISLVNKERVEVLKGTSGIQAGTSAPGGLANYVVKRPTATPLRRITLSTGDRGNAGVEADLSQRFGDDARYGVRLNLAHADRQPEIERYGHRRNTLAAIAADARLTRDTLLETELEWSRQTGASLPGYSLLGTALPAPVHPVNLNDQPWSLPNVFDGTSGTLRLDHSLAQGWRWVTTLGTQRLKTDDRLAYAYGFDCNPTSSFQGDFYCDRYGPNGNFDLYDFRSEGERRRTHALQTALQGRLDTGPIRHDLRAGVMWSRVRYLMPRQAFNYVGTGNVDGSLVTAADPSLTDEGTNRRERSTEFFANDAIDWGHGVTTWVGLRHTRLARDSVRTDGSRATGYSQSATTPWIAASWAWAPRQLAYLSWGEGIESAVVPGRADLYADAGVALPVLKSRQWEAGLRGAGETLHWNLAWFDITRPAIADLPGNGTPGNLGSYRADGQNRHRGVELAGGVDIGPWGLDAGAMWLDAKRRRSSDAGLNGQRPVNVPRHTLKLRGHYQLAAVPGLELQAGLVHEGRRNVLPDGSIELPSWTRVDVGTSWVQTLPSARLTWRAGIDNLFDKRAWKESPLQYGHVYLFPLEARTWRVSLQTDF